MKFLKLIHSKGSFPIDHDEVDIVKKCISSGTIGQLRSGIFNPSYFVSIEEDKDRKKTYLDDLRHKPKGYSSPILKLESIFDQSNLKRIAPAVDIEKLRAQNNIKRIN